MRYVLSGLALLASLGTGLAGDPWTMNLKGSTGASANTVPVFHRYRAWYRPPPVYFEPVVVAAGYCDGIGVMDGGYSIAPPAVFGGNTLDYAARQFVPALALARPSRPFYAVPAPAYAPEPAPTFNPPSATRAIVTLPRLGISFSIGDNGLLANRGMANNRITPPAPAAAPPPAYVPPTPPPPTGRPDQYRYDGGPSNPIPMPAETPSPTPAFNNRVRAMPARAGYLAFGDRPSTIIKPNAKVNTTFVRDR